MIKNINEALNNVDMTYDELIDIVDDIFKPIVEDINIIIKDVDSNAENMTNEQLRNSLLRLSLKAFSLSDIKEKSAFKAELAETIRKEAYAKTFNQSEGTVASKENNAIISVSDEIVTEEIHNLLSQLFKTKLDEVHRVIDAMKTVLMSRLSEAKLVSISDAQE